MDRPSRRQFLQRSLALAGVSLLSGCGLLPSRSQQGARIPRIGFLGSGSAESFNREPFVQGMRDLGWVEGQTVAIEWRFAEATPEALPALAAELVRLPVDIVVTSGTPATLAVKTATSTIPIVQAVGAGDLVQEGVVASLAHPGGNVTGLTAISVELTAKRLDLLKQTIPGLRRVAVLWNPTFVSAASAFGETQAAAQALGIRLQSLEVRSPDELESLLAAATGQQADALILLTDSITVVHGARIARRAATSRLPSIFDRRAYAVEGGLIGYGPDFLDMPRRAATYVDKILKGARPADLPVERPARFDFVINLQTARDIGLTIPQEVLMQATEVVQ